MTAGRVPFLTTPPATLSPSGTSANVCAGLVETEFTGERLFPQERRLKAAFRKLLLKNVFSDYELPDLRVRSQNGWSWRLRMVANRSRIWCGRQVKREFIPLLPALLAHAANKSVQAWAPPLGGHRRARDGSASSGRQHCAFDDPGTAEPRLSSVPVHTLAANPGDGMGPQELEGSRSNGRCATACVWSACRRDPSWSQQHRVKKDVSVHYFHGDSGKVHDISALDPSADRPLKWDGEALPTSASVRTPRWRSPSRRRVDELQRGRRGPPPNTARRRFDVGFRPWCPLRSHNAAGLRES